MNLKDLGWNKRFEKEFEPFRKWGWVPARLIRDHKISYHALLGDGEELSVVLSGKVYHEAVSDADLPAVGDWVAVEIGQEGEDHVIRARLSRQTCFSRKAPGRSTEEQVIAANVNVVVVVTDAGVDFNLRRMERYFTIIARSGAKPVVLINKADLTSHQENREALKAIKELNSDAEVHVTCAEKGISVNILKSYLKRGQTMALIGSSGVGKSTIMNQLLGEDYQWTDEVNESTGKGRHTTSARELIILPEGGILIDNPGIREVQMWTDEQTLRERFSDLDEIASRCKFSDCKHGSDENCAIREAMEAGDLDQDRYESYLKLEEEIEQLNRLRQKRQMTLERISKRHQKARAKRTDQRQDPESYIPLRKRRQREE